MFATQPFSKRSRAFAMSSPRLNTGTPTASTLFNGERTRCRMISMSWIIRSSTTPISMLRFGYGESRCDSMKRGRVSRDSSAPSTGLNRSMWPTCRTSPRAWASSARAFASVAVSVIGFSTRTCLPRSRRNFPTGKWVGVGVATVAASTSDANSSSDVHAFAPKRAAISCAVAVFVSWIAANSTSPSSEKIRA